MHLELLNEINQHHIVQAYQKATEQERNNLDAQITTINLNYPGGIRAYYHNALKLLKESAEGVNPYADYEIGKPQGVSINFGDLEKLIKYQKLGWEQFQYTGFVLVAGGLGQRLGYPGIKISIPMDLLTEKPFISYYIQYLLAFQKKYCPEGVKIPLAIMTSDDTHSKTVALLQQNQYFGLQKQQLTIMKQEKIPAMINNEAHFALLKDKLQIQTKPHGHGDVHTLIYNNDLANKWQKQGKKWIIVFQDTNPFAFRSFSLLLGISSERKYDFNTICVPRKPGEAVGAITTLQHKTSHRTLAINVEYNQLEGLFKESGGQKTDQNGYSLFPGNTNCFAIKISTYIDVLNKTKGLISQFINPKYTDNTKTTFKSSTRLECLMQDYPKLLDNCDYVGFSDIPKGYSFTTVKNDLATANTKIKQGLSGESAGSCEADIYYNNRVLLRLCGAQIEQADPVECGGSKLPMYPKIVFSPNFATCFTELKEKIKRLKVSAYSSLVIEADCILEDVEIDGHYEIIENGIIKINNADQNYTKLVSTVGHEPPHLLIRGYKLKEKTE